MGRLSHVRWRRVALQYGCTTCGAPPGKPCVTSSNHLSLEIHVARSRLAAADHWTLHEEPAMNICPDCENGKHDNCTNEAWDFEKDKAVPCDCHARNHEAL